MLFSISTAYVDGGKGALDLADKVQCINPGNFKLLYDLSDSIENKVKRVYHEIYGAKNVFFSDIAIEKINNINNNNLSNLPICVAKTQYSFSDDKNKVGVPKNFDVTVRDVELYNGAGFITILLGDILTMPGLSRNPNYELIDVVNGKIVNLN